MSPALRGLKRDGALAVPYPPHHCDAGSSCSIHAIMSWVVLPVMGAPKSANSCCAHIVGDMFDTGAGAGGLGGVGFCFCCGSDMGDHESHSVSHDGMNLVPNVM